MAARPGSSVALGGRRVSRLAAFGLFWWDFVVGDDWMVAAGIALSIAASALIAHAGFPAWWALPVLVAAVLAGSIRRAIRAGG